MAVIRAPRFKQSPAHCGPACLKIVLAYYGKKVSERAVARVAGTTLATGTSPENLVRTAWFYGLTGRWKTNATVEDLERWVEKGVPVIVNWFSHDEGHYSVVVGVDAHRVVLLDPEIGRRRSLSRETFMRVWFDFGAAYIQKKSQVRVRWMLPLRPAKK